VSQVLHPELTYDHRFRVILGLASALQARGRVCADQAVGAVDPDAMQDDCHFSGHGDLRRRHVVAMDQSRTPGLQRAPALCLGQQNAGRREGDGQNLYRRPDPGLFKLLPAPADREGGA
jgi:hypothetical protein